MFELNLDERVLNEAITILGKKELENKINSYVKNLVKSYEKFKFIGMLDGKIGDVDIKEVRDEDIYRR